MREIPVAASQLLKTLSRKLDKYTLFANEYI